MEKTDYIDNEPQLDMISAKDVSTIKIKLGKSHRKEYSNEPVDISRVMIMCLIHDIVEIDAGDTYAYDNEGLTTQKAREDAAKERIFSLLPEDQKAELIALFDEFEDNKTPEAKFAHAMDNLQPLMLNNSNGDGVLEIK